MNLREQIDRYGYRKASYDILLRLAYRVAGGQLFNCYLLPGEVPKKRQVRIDPQFQYGFLDQAQLLELIDPAEMTMTRDFALKALAKGDHCFGVMDGRVLAHYSWFATTSTDVVDGFALNLPGGSVYLYNAHTGSGYRGKRLFPFAVQEAVSAFLDQGCCRTLTLIAANNFGSISGVERIGFQPIGRLAVAPRCSSRAFSSASCLDNGIKLERPA